nr:hypothetical protein [Tanacetum cinerariifolium]
MPVQCPSKIKQRKALDVTISIPRSILPAVSRSKSHVTGDISGVPGAKTRVYTPAPGRSKALNGLPDTILSSEPKPLVQHRPLPPQSVWSPDGLSYPPYASRPVSIPRPPVGLAVKLSPIAYLEPRANKHDLSRGGIPVLGISSLQSTGGGMYRGGGSGGSGGDDDGSNGDGTGGGKGVESLPSFLDAYSQSLEALLSQPAVSRSKSHVTGDMSGLSGAKTRLYTPAPGGSKALNGLPDTILSSEPKPLVQHRPPPLQSVWSLDGLSYPSYASRPALCNPSVDLSHGHRCYLRNCLCWIYLSGGMYRGGGSGGSGGDGNAAVTASISVWVEAILSV